MNCGLGQNQANSFLKKARLAAASASNVPFPSMDSPPRKPLFLTSSKNLPYPDEDPGYGKSFDGQPAAKTALLDQLEELAIPRIFVGLLRPDAAIGVGEVEMHNRITCLYQDLGIRSEERRVGKE